MAGRGGAGQLAEPDQYTRRVPETGELRVLEPQTRLVQMLGAFDRHMKVDDVRTYEVALNRINERLIKGGVKSVVVVPTDGDERTEPVLLHNAPSLAGARQRLIALLEKLASDPRESR
jgi:hypothetical protein